MATKILIWLNSLPLRLKLIIPTWLLITISLVVGGVIITNFVIQHLDRQLALRANVLSKGVINQITPDLIMKNEYAIREGISHITYDPEFMSVVVFSNAKEIFTRTDRLPGDCKTTQDSITCAESSYIEIVNPIKLGRNEIGEMRVYFSRKYSEEKQERLMWIIGLGIFVMSAISLFFSHMIHRLISRPITGLHHSMAEVINTGKIEKKINVIHNDEVGKLAHCFNQMIDSLTFRDIQLKKVLNNIAEKNEYIHEMINSLTQGVMVIAPKDQLTFINPVGKQFMIELLGDSVEISQFMKNFEPPEVMRLLSDSIDAHVPVNNVEVKHIRTNRIFRVNSSPMATEQHSVVQFEEITAQYEAERSRNLAQHIFGHNKNSVIVLTRRFEVDAQNEASLKLIGKLSSYKDLKITDDFIIKYSDVKQLLLSGSAQWSSYLLNVDGESFPCIISAHTILNDKNEVTSILIFITDQSLNHQLQQLNYIANHDALTGLINRTRAFELLNTFHQIGNNLHLLFIDLDGFKQINDQYGHHIGDELLKVVAKRLSSSVANCDLVARLSGDEFLLSLVDSNDHQIVVNRLLKKLSSSIIIDGLTMQVSASIGVKYWSATDETPLENAIRVADKAMYQAKKNGKNSYHLSD